MKYGYRKPSITKSVSARITGNVKRKVKSAVNPLYGKEGMGYINDTKKAIYNKMYNNTTKSIFDNQESSFDNMTLAVVLTMLIVLGLVIWGRWSFFSWLLE